MLKLICDNEEAHIDSSGIVDYFEYRGDGLVTTEVPSQRIMQMVLALVPFVGSEVLRAEVTVAAIRRALSAIVIDAAIAEDNEHAACRARDKVTAEQRELSHQLASAEEVLRFAQMASAG